MVNIMIKKTFIRLWILSIIFSGMSLSGCIPILFALNTLGAGMSKASDYIVSNRVVKTVNYEIDLIKEGAVIALNKMGVFVEEIKEIDQGEEIFAKAYETEITIELKKLTPMLTRMEITAKSGAVGRDKATAREVVAQTIFAVEQLNAKKHTEDTLAYSTFSK